MLCPQIHFLVGSLRPAVHRVSEGENRVLEAKIQGFFTQGVFCNFLFSKQKHAIGGGGGGAKCG